MPAPVTLRAATREELLAAARGPLPDNTRGLAIVRGDQVLGVGGVAHVADYQLFLAFASLTDEARRHPVAVHKAGKRSLQIAREMGAEWVVSVANGSVPAAARWLERLGYQAAGADPLTGEQVYVQCLSSPS